MQAKRRSTTRSQWGPIIASQFLEFTDTDPAWTDRRCVNLPTPGPEWNIEKLIYTAYPVNPDWSWFLRYVSIFRGPDCKDPEPLLVPIEDLNDEPGKGTIWLDPENNPYYGVRYDIEVAPGTIRIDDPEGLLNQRLNFWQNERLQMQRTEEYLDQIANEDASAERVQYEPINAGKDVPDEIKVWPDNVFSGATSILLISDNFLFHLEPDAEYRGREELGEELYFGPATAGELLDSQD
ncbi:hypothetical protein ABW21_db0202610 [Orbilia brochopaga]|nr:hypothetical protein ABW21_db0202610 [Drechslerella brochopaga]